MDIKREIRFIDSQKFMMYRLDNLVGNLEKEQCKNLAQYFEDEELDLLLRKGVYPYDYMNSFSKLKQRSLPPKEAFFSKLYESDISDEDYARAEKVWKFFNMKRMREYHNLYLKTDVLQLADVFENFRDISMKNYQLDPSWYYTTPGMAWDVSLKYTKVELELLSDPDMLLMIEGEGIRGGISTISTRYGKANNPYMKECDSIEPTKYITYLDANNIYGLAMSNKLPTHGFEWMKEKELKKWHKMPCVLEVPSIPTQSPQRFTTSTRTTQNWESGKTSSKFA